MPLKLKEKQKTVEAAGEREAQKTEEQKLVAFYLVLFGLTQIEKMQVKPGTKLKDILAARNLDGVEVRVGGASVRGDYVIKENDRVVIIPDSIEGGG